MRSILLMENAEKIFRDRRGRLLGIRIVSLRKPILCSNIVDLKSSVFDRLSHGPHDLTD